MLSRRRLIEVLVDHFEGDMITLSSPGIASVLAFKSRAANILHSMPDDTGPKVKFPVLLKVQYFCMKYRLDFPPPDMYIIVHISSTYRTCDARGTFFYKGNLAYPQEIVHYRFSHISLIIYCEGNLTFPLNQLPLCACKF